MRKRKTSDKIILESLLNKYGKNKLVRAINEMSSINKNIIIQDVRDIVDWQLNKLDDNEREYVLYNVVNHRDEYDFLLDKVLRVFANKNGLNDYDMDESLRDDIEDAISEYTKSLLEDL